jgi:AcrR family transcriptional regulator
MATSPKGMDRRAQRTRQILRQAYIDVVREKGFTAASIQEITERANVNRGTFYAHFPDKYALLETLLREAFQRHLARALPPVSQWNRQTFFLLIQTVLDYFKGIHRQCHPSNVLDPLIEQIIPEELTSLFLTWLKQRTDGQTELRVSRETLAHVMSWAIFGAAVQWSQEATVISREQIAHDVLLVLMEGMARLAPDALPE